MIIDDFNVKRIAILESEADAPRPVDRHCPLTGAIARQLVQANGFERAYVPERRRGVEHRQKLDCGLLIKTGKLALAVFREFAGRAVCP